MGHRAVLSLGQADLENQPLRGHLRERRPDSDYGRLIAFLLLRLTQEAYKNRRQSPLAFARLIQATLMERRSIAELLQPPPRPKREPRQIKFEFDAAATRAVQRRRASRACAAIEKAA